MIDQLLSNRRRVARVLLFLGLMAVLLYWGKTAPQPQPLLFKFEQAESVHALKVTCSTLEGDPLRHFTLHPNSGPVRTIAHEVELPNGEYRISVELQLTVPQSTIAGGHSPTRELSRNVDRVVALDGSRKVIFL